jgi:phosphopantetheine adenylyltransferase
LKDPVSSISRRIRWKYAQSLIAGLYVIVASVCAERGIATDVGAPEAGSVDVRVVLVDHEKDRKYDPEQQWSGDTTGNGTTVPDLGTFATAKQPWQTVFHPNSEDGYGILEAYLKLAEGKQKFLQKQLVAVDYGTALTTENERDEEDNEEPNVTKGYSSVCLGGTFDHLHVGHKLLLHATALLIAFSGEKTRELIIGISGDALLVKKQYAEELQPWTSRARSVISFLSTIIDLTVSNPSSFGAGNPAPKDNEELQASMRHGGLLIRCVNIPDPFGPTITEEGIQAIVVSAETRGGGAAINDRRSAKGWEPLNVYEIDVLDAGGIEEDDGADGKESFESKISSTTIRKQRMEARATQGA